MIQTVKLSDKPLANGYLCLAEKISGQVHLSQNQVDVCTVCMCSHTHTFGHVAEMRVSACSSAASVFLQIFTTGIAFRMFFASLFRKQINSLHCAQQKKHSRFLTVVFLQRVLWRALYYPCFPGHFELFFYLTIFLQQKKQKS